MNFIDRSKRLDYVLEMIKKGRLNSPKQLIEKYNCCDKTARNMIRQLKGMGYSIIYSNSCKKYVLKSKR